MKKIVCLLGKTASGKTTIAKELIDKYGFHNWISYTTRPMRDGEKDGKDYYFVTDEEFAQLPNKIDERAYKVYDGSVWRYSHTDNYKGCSIVVVDRKGLEDYRNFYGKENIFAVYIDSPDGVRKFRYLNRQKNDSDYDAIQKEWERRNEDDNNVFNGIENDDIDMVIFNTNVSRDSIQQSIDNICREIVDNFNRTYRFVLSNKKRDIVEQYSLFIREMLNDGRIENDDAKTLSTIFNKTVELIEDDLN